MDEDGLRYCGKLFIESNRQLESAQKTINDLRQQVAKATQERDDALRLLKTTKES